MRLMAVATGVLTARFLGPSGKGMLTLFVAIAGAAMMLLSLGVNNANVYFIGRGKPKQIILGNTVAFWAVAGLIGFSGIYFGRGLIGNVMPDGSQDQSWWLLTSAVFVLTLGSGLIGGILVGEQKFLKISISGLTRTGTYLLLLLIFLPFLDMGLRGVLLALLSGLLISNALTWYFVRAGPGQLPLRTSILALGESITYGLKAQIGDNLQWANYRLDVFVVGYFLSAAAVGWYAIAVVVAELVLVIPSSVASVLFPTSAKIGDEQASRLTSVVFRQTLVLVIFTCLTVAGSARFLIPLAFGQEFLPALTPLYLLLPGIAALGLWKVLNGDLCGRGLPLYGTLSAAVALIVTIAADLTLIPLLGIAGAAIATSLSYMTSSLIILVAFLKVSNVPISSLFLPRMEDTLAWQRFTRGLVSSARNR